MILAIFFLHSGGQASRLRNRRIPTDFDGFRQILTDFPNVGIRRILDVRVKIDS